MDKWLPSRKIVLFFGVLAIIIVGLFLFFNLKNKNVSYKKTETELKLEKNNKLITDLFIKQSEQDNDNDGLKNWEEELWKTDINNFDTDGDGTGDGDEIKENRNPLIKGPDDLLKENNFYKENYSKDINNKTTNDLGKELIGEYLFLKNKGILNEKNKENLIKSIVSNKINSIKNENKEEIFTTKDLNIIESENKKVLTDYSQNIVEILKQGLGLENELIILERALTDNDKSILNKLDDSIFINKKIKEDFISMDVPRIVVKEHLNLINNITNIIYGIEKMKLVFENPMETLANLKFYQSSTKKAIESFIKINLILKEKGLNIK